ncbi:MAG TPA: aconitate hydratase [Erysipelothrix sp.]|nr:aconitate hydratase [Erysipelothrix sp.]
MGKSLAYKILEKHLLHGELIPGQEVAIKIDQTLTQDSTGTMVYLQLEAMNIDEIKTDLSVAYIDHNTLQSGFENADDHAFIQSSALRHGVIFSKPGGGICHQVHLERFAKPGTTLIGSDSHTPTCGGIGAIAIGAGGLDVAIGMAQGIYFLTAPKVYKVELTGKMSQFVNGKDVILKVLQELSVKGGVGYIMEYGGPGVKNLSVTDRATICNMGAELGATTSIFPSDENTLDYLKRHNREEDYVELKADEDAQYDEIIHINMDTLKPMTALPFSPDNVVSVQETLKDKVKVDQVVIGSCTNSSYSDMMKVAAILKGKRVHPDVSLAIAPGSSNILRLLSENGALTTLIASGARILESACGPCIGMGQAPRSGAVSLRSFNRNFLGRDGGKDSKVYLVSPETAAASAVEGYLVDPEDLDLKFVFEEPESYGKVDHYFIFPEDKHRALEVDMGPNIKPFPVGKEPTYAIEKTVLLKAGDNVTTDDIVPSNAKMLPYRSNIPHLANFTFTTLVDDFKDRAEKYDGGIIVGGDNYGQGSSREHAALVPLYLGVKAVIAKTFARIHRSNLINSGILPLVFKDKSDYDSIDEFDVLDIKDIPKTIKEGTEFSVYNKTKDETYTVIFEASKREREILEVGGYLNFASKGDFGFERA